MAILLPLWVIFGFYLSQLFIAGVLVVLDSAGISLGGINRSVLDSAIAAIVYLLTAVIVLGVPGPGAVRSTRTTRTTLADLGLDRWPSWQDILLAFGGFIVYLLCSSVLISLAIGLFPGFDAEQAQDVGFENLGRRYEYVLAFLTLVVIAPVAEEVLMRGYLYGKLRRIIPMVWSMLITAILFAVLHLQWNVAVDVFALSLILTTLREVTGSIWTSILVHMLKNGLAFYLLFINSSLFNTLGA